MIDRSTIEKIIEAARIEEVIGEFVSLKRRGANYMACCPFHNEKTPSFSVSPSRGIYKCFGCGKAGNVVNFIMEHEHMSYVEALEYLGRKYHIEVKEKEEDPQEVARRHKSESMFVLNDFALKHFQNVLWEDPAGRSVGLAYFRERSLLDNTIRAFGLGYALPGKDIFCRQALEAGFLREYLIETGLAVHYEATATQEEALRDRFADRVMFPIQNLSGRVIGFGGRTLRSDKKTAKYVNSPESEIYKKSRTLYGIFQAKQSLSRLQKCYLVEGYMDVLQLYQSGITNVVASSGTALTTDQIRLIRRFAPRVTVLYDGDAAGIKASIRGIDMLLEEGLQVKVVRFPEEHDPDSYARTHSALETKQFLDSHEEDFIRFKIALMQDEMADPLTRAGVIREVVQSISVVPDAIVRQVYIEEASSLLNMEAGVLTREVAKIRRKRMEQYGNQAMPPLAESGAEEGETGSALKATRTMTPAQVRRSVGVVKQEAGDITERDVLYYLLKFGRSLYVTQDIPQEMGYRVCDYIFSTLKADELEFKTPLYKVIYDEYAGLADPDDDSCQRYFLNHPTGEIAKLAMEMLYEDRPITIKRYKESIEPEEFHLPKLVTKAVLVFKSRVTQQACEALQRQLEQAQAAGDQERMNEVMMNFNLMLQVRNAFLRELNRIIC